MHPHKTLYLVAVTFQVEKSCFGGNEYHFVMISQSKVMKVSIESTAVMDLLQLMAWSSPSR